MISLFTDTMRTLGLPNSYGEIYGLLFASPSPLGFSEIHARLAISKGSVSQGLKALREVGAIVECGTDAEDGGTVGGEAATVAASRHGGLQSSHGAAGGRDSRTLGGEAALDHRRRYRPQLELRQLVVAFLERSVQPQLQSTEERLRLAEKHLAGMALDPTARVLLADRLSKLQTWRRKAAGLVPWITKFLG